MWNCEAWRAIQHKFQGLFLADFIAVIRLYSQCQKVSFFPNFQRKIPNLKPKKIKNKSSICRVKVGLKLFVQHTGIQWTTLFCIYFVMCGLIAQWPSKFNASIHRLIDDIFFVTKCLVKWAVIWWNLFSFEHLYFLIYPKCTFVRMTAFSLLSMNNYTVL